MKNFLQVIRGSYVDVEYIGETRIEWRMFLIKIDNDFWRAISRKEGRVQYVNFIQFDKDDTNFCEFRVGLCVADTVDLLVAMSDEQFLEKAFSESNLIPLDIDTINNMWGDYGKVNTLEGLVDRKFSDIVQDYFPPQ